MPNETNINFSVSSKVVEYLEFGELYLFKWTIFLILSITPIVLNMVGVEVYDVINKGIKSWSHLFRKLFSPQWTNIDAEHDSYCCGALIVSSCNYFLMDFSYDSIASGVFHSIHIDISTLSVAKNLDRVVKSVSSVTVIDALHLEMYKQYTGRTRG